MLNAPKTTIRILVHLVGKKQYMTSTSDLSSELGRQRLQSDPTTRNSALWSSIPDTETPTKRLILNRIEQVYSCVTYFWVSRGFLYLDDEISKKEYFEARKYECRAWYTI